MAQKRTTTLVRRTQIIDAAQKVIVKYGSEHVTVRRIAKEVGVSEGAIYRHFKSKKDILSFLLDSVEQTLLSEIEMKPANSLATLAEIERVITNHMSHVVERRGVSFLTIAEIVSLGDRQLNTKAYGTIDKYVRCVRDILSAGAKSGVIRKDIDLDAAATLFFGMTDSLVSIWTLSRYSFDLQERYASLWKTLREMLVVR